VVQLEVLVISAFEASNGVKKVYWVDASKTWRRGETANAVVSKTTSPNGLRVQIPPPPLIPNIRHIQPYSTLFNVEKPLEIERSGR
jgi:hypothetical protein